MSLKSHWQHLKKSPPGQRFKDFYEARQKERTDGQEWKRILYVGLGVVISLGGIILLGMPGPGLLVVAFGLALIASEFLVIARLLDRAELWLRKMAHRTIQGWRKMRPYQRGLSILALSVILIGAVGCAYKILV